MVTANMAKMAADQQPTTNKTQVSIEHIPKVVVGVAGRNHNILSNSL